MTRVASLRRYLALAVLAACAACTAKSPQQRFEAHESEFSRLSGWEEEHHAEALRVFLSTCPSMLRRSPATSSASGLQVPVAVWQSLCAEARHASGSNEKARRFFESRFMLYDVENDGNPEGLFTGYYEPLLHGSYKKGGRFIHPVYAKPKDFERYSRAEIDGGKLAGRGLEIAWVDDPVMLFFMHVQGSGRIRMTDGKDMLVGFAAKNGRDYVSIGKVVGDEGYLPKDKIDFFTIRKWMQANPARAVKVMQRNPSYIFFKKRDEAGPVGAAGAVLTPMRSLAVDNSYIPYGLPLFLETYLPGQPGQADTPFNRIMIAQDTGSAIKGAVRGDIFFGAGDKAEYYAGSMKNRGRYTLLVPKEIARQLR